MGAGRISRSMVFFPTCWNMSNIYHISVSRSHLHLSSPVPRLVNKHSVCIPEFRALWSTPCHAALPFAFLLCLHTSLLPVTTRGEERAISPFGHSSPTCSHTLTDKDVLISPASLSVAAKNKPHRMGKTPSQCSCSCYIQISILPKLPMHLSSHPE